MTRCGMPARFPRTGSACWKETSPKRSFRGFWEKHGPGSCSVTNTSRWMEHCWKLGRRTKASGQSILWARITIRRSEEHTSELQSRLHLVCRLLLEKKKKEKKKSLRNRKDNQ